MLTTAILYSECLSKFSTLAVVTWGVPPPEGSVQICAAKSSRCSNTSSFPGPKTVSTYECVLDSSPTLQVGALQARSTAVPVKGFVATRYDGAFDLVWSWAEAPEAMRRTVASARETRSPRRSEPPHFPVLDFTSLGPRIFVFKLSILPVLVSHGGSSWSCSVSALRVATVTSSHCGTERRSCVRFHAPCQGPVLAFLERGCSRKKNGYLFFRHQRCGYGNQGRKSMLCFLQNCFLLERGRKGPRIKARLLDRLGPLLPPAFSPGTALFSPHHELASASFAVSKEVASIPRRPEGGRGGEGARL